MDSVHRNVTAACVGVSSPWVRRCKPTHRTPFLANLNTMGPNRQKSPGRFPRIPPIEPVKEKHKDMEVLLQEN